MDWSHFFELLFAAAIGSGINELRRWITFRREFPYRWQCKNCGLRLNFSNEDVLMDVILDHNQQFHPIKEDV